MQAIITGCGRSGTNLLTEMVRATGAFSFTRSVEDRGFFDKTTYPDGYGTKIAVEWDSFTYEPLKERMELNPDMHLLWAFRHPYDVVLSKIYRGRPKSMGGDNTTEQWAKDGTLESAVTYVEKSWDIYCRMINLFSPRVMPVIMENILLHTRQTAHILAGYLNVNVTAGMLEPWKHNRNPYQNNRYHKTMDKREFYKWGDLETNYNGYFGKRYLGDLKKINGKIKEQAKYFNYGLI